MDLTFNPCCEFRWSSEDPVSQIHSPLLHVGAPGIFSDLVRSVQMITREWSTESNGKLPHIFVPSKTAALVPEFAVKDMLFGRTATLVPAFAVKDLPLVRTLWWWWITNILDHRCTRMVTSFFSHNVYRSSIPGQFNFLLEVFPGIFAQL